MPAPIPPVVAWWALPSDLAARAHAARLGVACLAPGDGPLALRNRGVEVVHVFLPVEALRAAVLATTLGGAIAVVVTP